jgi:hypothetical protein
MKQGTYGHTRKNVRMFVIGRVARKGSLGSTIASTYVLSLKAVGPYTSRQTAPSTTLYQVAIEPMPRVPKDFQQVGCS